MVVLMETHFRLSVKDKGRTVLPTALQRECGFAVGAELIARPLGPGRFLVETADAVLDRIWSGVPTDGPTDAVAELAAWRTHSSSERMAALSAGAPDADGTETDHGAELLRELGL